MPYFIRIYVDCRMQGRAQGGCHMGHDPPLEGQGHHRPVRGTIGLSGAPQACQGHHKTSRDATYMSWAPQACQEHHRLSKGTTGVSGAPVRGTMGLPGVPQACQGHHLSNRDTTGLSGAPPSSRVGIGLEKCTEVPTFNHISADLCTKY